MGKTLQPDTVRSEETMKTFKTFADHLLTELKQMMHQRDPHTATALRVMQSEETKREKKGEGSSSVKGERHCGVVLWGSRRKRSIGSTNLPVSARYSTSCQTASETHCPTLQLQMLRTRRSRKWQGEGVVIHLCWPQRRL